MRITNGAVLELTGSRAVVIDAQESERLHLKARDAEGGIQLGWHAGHLHWRVRMSGAYATVLLDGPRDDYLVRIERFLDSGVIEVVDSAPGTDGADAATPESLTHSHGAHGHVHVHGQELEHAHEAAPAGER
ncbi:hypothetical protein NJE57_12955 [Dietzia sp. PP-33]|nr:hypothetical protein [Dietzia sp. PP-33]